MFVCQDKFWVIAFLNNSCVDMFCPDRGTELKESLYFGVGQALVSQWLDLSKDIKYSLCHNMFKVSNIVSPFHPCGACVPVKLGINCECTG